MYGYQTASGYYVTTFPSKVKLGDAATTMWSRVQRRMAISMEMLQEVSPEVDYRQQFILDNCQGPHEAMKHERFCSLCRGEVGDSYTLVTGNRVCKCEHIGTPKQTFRCEEPPGSPIRRTSESEDQ